MWRGNRIRNRWEIVLLASLLAFLLLLQNTSAYPHSKIIVFTTNPYFKPIIEEIGGEYVEVFSITTSSDLHSFSLSRNEAELLEKADLIFLTNSYDLGFEKSIKKSYPHKTVDFDDYTRNGAKLKEFDGYLNPHGYWLNLSNTIAIAKTIEERLSNLIPEGDEYFRNNFEGFKTKIKILSIEIKDVANAQRLRGDCVAIIPALAYIIDNSQLNTSAILLEEEGFVSGKDYIEIERKLENSELNCIVAPKSMKESKIGYIAEQLSKDTGKPVIYVEMFLGNKTIEAMHLLNALSFKDLKTKHSKDTKDSFIYFLYLIIALESTIILILWWRR
jgi:zinc/manganese transport system substrate-binding protein